LWLLEAKSITRNEQMGLTKKKHLIYRTVCLAILFIGCGPDRNKRLSESFNGIVIKKSETQPCFGMIIISRGKIIDTLKDVCICSQANGDVWRYLSVGDSIFKQKGSLSWHIVRKGIDKTFDYPSCYK